MTTEEMHTALYEKFSAEQDNYRAWLLKQTPEEIIQHSYEYTVREDIVMMMEDAELSPQQAAALLWKGTTLSDIYKDFTKIETGYMDILRDTVENRANDILKEAEALRSAPVYPYPREYAVENDELDKYRLSRKASIACKEAIEQAIGEHYANNSLDTVAAVKQVVDAFGYDRTMYVLAVTAPVSMTFTVDVALLIFLFFNAMATKPNPKAWYVMISITWRSTILDMKPMGLRHRIKRPAKRAEGRRLRRKRGTLHLIRLATRRAATIRNN